MQEGRTLGFVVVIAVVVVVVVVDVVFAPLAGNDDARSSFFSVSVPDDAWTDGLCSRERKGEREQARL